MVLVREDCHVTLRSYTTRPTSFPIVHKITKSEIERGYMYVTNSSTILARFNYTHFSLDLAGCIIKGRALAGGRVIVGRRLLCRLCKCGDVVVIDSPSRDLLEVKIIS
jgi:hypothetical protein